MKTRSPSVTMEVTVSVVEAEHLLTSREDHLVTALDFADDRRDVVRHFWPFDFPDNVAVRSLHPADRAALLVVGRDDDEVLVDCGGGPEALVHDVIGDPRLPELRAGQVKGGGVDRTVVHEVDEEALPVAGRTRGGVGGLPVDLLRKVPFVHDFAPHRLAGLAVEAEQRLRLRLPLRRDEINPFAHHDRRAMSLPRNGRHPKRVLFGAEPGRELLIGIGVAISVRSAPPRPVVLAGVGGHGQESRQDEQDGKQIHGANGTGKRSRRRARLIDQAIQNWTFFPPPVTSVLPSQPRAQGLHSKSKILTARSLSELGQVLQWIQ